MLPDLMVSAVDPMLPVLIQQVERGNVSARLRVTLSLNARVVSGEIFTESRYRELLPRMVYGHMDGIIHNQDDARKRDALAMALGIRAQLPDYPAVHILTDGGAGIERVRLDQVVAMAYHLLPGPKDGSQGG